MALETAIGAVHGEEGFFQYRGHDATALARDLPFESVWHLVTLGSIPGPSELREWRERTARARALPHDLHDLDALVRGMSTGQAGPMSALRTLVSAACSLEGMGSWLDTSPEDIEGQAVRIAALFPTLVCALHRIRSGQRTVDPRSDLSHAENFLWMLTGTGPVPRAAAALETYWSMTVDHGLNSSTFTARVIASTGADLGAVVTGALGALSGPLHGGAPSRVLEMLDLVGRPEEASAWLAARVDAGERIMGFGHRVYRGSDPRAGLLRSLAMSLDPPRLPLALAVEDAALAILAERHPERSLPTNVEFWAAVVLEAVGLPGVLHPLTFACSRVVGWLAHAIEQASANRLIRPRSLYVGPRDSMIPIDSKAS